MNMALEWLKSAQDDLTLINAIIDNPSITNLASFHAHQSIEKSLKALLVHNNINIPKKHDLIQLKDLTDNFIDIENEDVLEDLNSLYIESRYPLDLGLLPNGKPTVEEATMFYKFATKLFNKTKEIIS